MATPIGIDLRYNKDHVAITLRLPYFYVLTLTVSLVIVVWNTGNYNCEISAVFVSTVVTTTAYLLEKYRQSWT